MGATSLSHIDNHHLEGAVSKMTNCTLALIVLISATAHAAAPVERINKNGVALCAERDSTADADCFDPVSYIVDGKAVKAGGENAGKFRFKYKNATYVFVSQAHLELFKATPERFLPQFGGWCAYAVAAKQAKVDIDPTSFHVQDGRLLLFYDGFLAHTKKTWLTDKSKDPKTYLSEADRNWPKVENREP